MSLPGIERWALGIHQKSVTRSLAAWAVEDARITNEASAVHAAERMGYIRSYSVPGPGYRGPLEVEAAWERQAASRSRESSVTFGTTVCCRHGSCQMRSRRCRRAPWRKQVCRSKTNSAKLPLTACSSSSELPGVTS